MDGAGSSVELAHRLVLRRSDGGCRVPEAAPRIKAAAWHAIH